MSDVCKKLQVEHNIAVKVYERGGMKIGNKTKADPLGPSTCKREYCFSFTSGGGGGGILAGAVLHTGCNEHLAGLSNEK